jgi:hypothetical protein
MSESLNRSTSHGLPLNGGHHPRQIQTASNEGHVNNDDLTPKGDASSQPDTDSNTSINPNPETSSTEAVCQE